MPRIFSKKRTALSEPVDLERIRELLQLAAEVSAVEVEIETGGVRIAIRQHAATVVMPQAAPLPSVTPTPQAPVVAPNPAPPASESAAVDPNQRMIKAPTPGTFYSRPAPDKDPFVAVGDKVSVGDTVCILEAMKLMNEIESEESGIIKEVLVADGEPVEYDQPLFLIGT